MPRVRNIKYKFSLFIFIIVFFSFNSSVYSELNLYYGRYRYPVRVEYSIISGCVSSSTNFFSIQAYSKKKYACIYALESVQKKMSYSFYRNNKRLFLVNFNYYVKKHLK